MPKEWKLVQIEGIFSEIESYSFTEFLNSNNKFGIIKFDSTTGELKAYYIRKIDNNYTELVCESEIFYFKLQ
jgi:hypothetical protein